MNGKKIRMNRITEKGKAIIIPMDHGTTDGPIRGLEDMDKIVSSVDAGGASAVLLHKGILRSIQAPTRCGIIMHMSASTRVADDPNKKVLVATVDDGVRLGADAVSVHIHIGGNESEPEMLTALGAVATECEQKQMPLLAMMYPRGKNVSNSMDPESVALAARVGYELGADIVKTMYTGDTDSFKDVIRRCPVPIVIAGGPKCSNDKDILEMVAGAMEGGAIGVSLGRNAFQHPNPSAIVHAIRSIIVEKASVEEVLKELRCAT
ncbi:MAG: 2-amino-3,7-dideoxy-D-threo-hept-6-ulosonate synthase [Candidatus Methanofastidiosia archaeon]